jgi:chromosome segregation protein
MNGFKSFGKETELPFNQGLNTVVGANGSGKSNVSDAICFVLGRLGAKSMRAKKTTGFLFVGTKSLKPAHEARVDIIFDNLKKEFSLDTEEVKVTRIVKKDGQSDYRLNDKQTTRQQILDILSQAGVDPYGFNIILQNEISRFVEMNGEERRQILEEVSGISVYELRKQQSIRELEKTEQKLAEVSAVLKERTLYMKNLEQERANALKYQETETLLKREKASLVYKNIKEKRGEKEKTEKEIEKGKEIIGKEREKINKKNAELNELNTEAESINKKIQDSTGYEQETLYKHMTAHKETIMSLKTRIENFTNQIQNTEERNEGLKNQIQESKEKLENLKKKLPEKEKVKKLLKQKVESFSEVQTKYEKLMRFKSEQSSLNSIYSQNEKNILRLNKQIEEQERKISEIRKEIQEFESEIKEIDKLKTKISDYQNKLSDYHKKHLESTSEMSKISKEIELLEKLKKQIAEIDVCPTCSRKITKEERKVITETAEKGISHLSGKKGESEKEIYSIISDISEIKKEIKNLEERHAKIHGAKSSLETLESREEFVSGLKNEKKFLDEDLRRNEKKLNEINALIKEFNEYESLYKHAREEIQNLTEKERESDEILLNINLTENELQQAVITIKRNNKEIEETESIIADLEIQLSGVQREMQGTEKVEQEMKKKFQSMIEKRNKLQESAKVIEQELIDMQINTRHKEENLNSLKIAIAQIETQHSIFISEFEQFGEVEIIDASKNELQNRISKHDLELRNMGSVNLRALQVYEGLKEEYDKVKEKAEIITKEEEEIKKIIAEIDRKKKITFMKTLKFINESFTRNFYRVSTKGSVFLEIENEEDPFAGGLDIILKQGKGKFFDVHSLSGGEQTLLAISLIFSIQEYKPYPFYILDEIDAALDKMNSEKLAALLEKYTDKAQYITITHNDAVIAQSNTLYGVSMQDGISQIVSLKL